MAKNSIYIGVILLAIIALFLGFQIYKQNSTPSKTAPVESQDTSSTPDQPSSAVKKLQSQGSATPSESLNITGCNPSPKQLQLKAGKDFTVINLDKVNHTIIIDATHQYVIPQGSTKTLSSSFGSSGIIGTIGYRCDNKDSADFAGTFHISE